MFQTGTSNISKSLRLLIANFASLWEDVLHGHLGLFCGTSRVRYFITKPILELNMFYSLYVLNMNLINVKETGALVDILYIFPPPKKKNMIFQNCPKSQCRFLTWSNLHAWRIHMAENL